MNAITLDTFQKERLKIDTKPSERSDLQFSVDGEQKLELIDLKKGPISHREEVSNCNIRMSLYNGIKADIYSITGILESKEIIENVVNPFLYNIRLQLLTPEKIEGRLDLKTYDDIMSAWSETTREIQELNIDKVTGLKVEKDNKTNTNQQNNNVYESLVLSGEENKFDQEYKNDNMMFSSIVPGPGFNPNLKKSIDNVEEENSLLFKDLNDSGSDDSHSQPKVKGKGKGMLSKKNKLTNTKNTQPKASGDVKNTQPKVNSDFKNTQPRKITQNKERQNFLNILNKRTEKKPMPFNSSNVNPANANTIHTNANIININANIINNSKMIDFRQQLEARLVNQRNGAKPSSPNKGSASNGNNTGSVPKIQPKKVIPKQKPMTVDEIADIIKKGQSKDAKLFQNMETFIAGIHACNEKVNSKEIKNEMISTFSEILKELDQIDAAKELKETRLQRILSSLYKINDNLINFMLSSGNKTLFNDSCKRHPNVFTGIVRNILFYAASMATSSAYLDFKKIKGNDNRTPFVQDLVQTLNKENLNAPSICVAKCLKNVSLSSPNALDKFIEVLKGASNQFVGTSGINLG